MQHSYWADWALRLCSLLNIVNQCAQYKDHRFVVDELS